MKFLEKFFGFWCYGDSEYFGDWVYFDFNDVYLQKNNLRCSPSTGKVQMLDVDGWCSIRFDVYP